MDKVAIVILNWNGKKHLEQFLPSVVLHSQGEGKRIIVADNFSSDDSIEFVKSSYPEIDIIQFDGNYGYTGGYNRALKQINAEYYVLLNSDVEVTSNWLNPVIEYMDNNQDVAAAMPKINSFVAKEYYEYAGAAGGYLDKYGFPFCRGRILSDIEKDEGQHDSNQEIFWASGACFFVRSSLFFKAEGFDEAFFAHMEEIDLCWRFKRMGYKVMSIPESKVYHVGGGTLPINTPFKMYLNYRNNLFLLQKNLPSNKLIPILIVRMLLDGLSAMVYLSRFSFGFFKAVLKAHLHFYRRLRKTHKARRKFKKIASTDEVSQIYPHSMVFNFIVRKRRKFDQYTF